MHPDPVTARRRPSLLTGLVALFLILLAGLPAAASRPASSGHGDAIAAAVGNPAVMVRTLPDRLAAAPRPTPDRHLAPTAALPAALVIAFLLAVRSRHAQGGTPTAQPRRLVGAGRGPPVSS